MTKYLLFFTVLFNTFLVSSQTKTNVHFDKALHYMQSYKFSEALGEFDIDFQKINPKNTGNQEFIEAMILKSRIYSHYEHLDSAEFCLLKASGISNDISFEICNSKSPATLNDFKIIIEKIEELIKTQDKYGYHIVLSFIYNIIEKHDEMKNQQQLVIALSISKEIPLSIAMQLYKIRGKKIDAYTSLLYYQDKIKTSTPEELENLEYNLSVQQYYLGWFKESELIVDKYLKVSPTDLSFLALKMNLQMVKGDYMEMKKTENKILKIDPKAFD